MANEHLLLDIFYYFLATTLCVPIFKKFGLTTIMGYLVAGILIGPSGLDWFHHTENLKDISHLGVILLLFVIGLELSPVRLKHMQRAILIMGSTQFISSTIIFTMILHLLDIKMIPALIIATSLALSSTAFALNYLKETEQLTKSYGQASFSILIYQDLIIIPIMALIPLIITGIDGENQLTLFTAFVNITIAISVFLLAKYSVNPLMSFIYNGQSREIFIGTSLMIIIGLSLLMEKLGLSKSLGAFVAGILLSGSKFKVEIQNFSVPLKSILMGVFFMSFGLIFNVKFFYNNFFTVSMITFSFIIIKMMVLIFIGKVFLKSWAAGVKMSGILSQGGEFGFLLIGLMSTFSLVDEKLIDIIISSITFSILLSPVMAKMTKKVKSRLKSCIDETETASSEDCKSASIDNESNNLVA